MDNIINIKNNFLSYEEIEKKTYEEFIKYINNNNNLKNIIELLNNIMIFFNIEHRFDILRTKNFLISYFFIFHNENVNNKDDDITKIMIKYSYDLILSFELLFKQEKTSDINNFLNNLYKYEKLYIDWKQRDALILIRPLLKSYFELNLLKELYEKQKNKYSETIEKQMGNIKKNILLISGDIGLKYLNEKKIPVFKSEKKVSEIEKTVKKAFWDIFQENIEQNKLEQIILFLQDIKNIYKDIIKNEKYLKSLFENIDIEIIENLIKKNLLNDEMIKNYILFLINKLYEIQPPIEDKNTKQFENEINDMYNKNMNKSIILRFFFENYFNKLENIKLLTYRLKNIKIEEI